MVYEYREEMTGSLIEKEFSIKENIPIEIKENGKTYKRVYGNSAIHIPFGWGDTKNRPKYNKSPSRRKHFY